MPINEVDINPDQEQRPDQSTSKSIHDVEESGYRGYNERDIDNWRNNVKIPAPIVVALAFVMNRSDRAFVTHAIHLLTKLLFKVTDSGELSMPMTNFVDKGSRLSKLVEQASRSTEDAEIMRLLCTEECGTKVDEFWETLKDQYSGPSSMINKEITVKELREKISKTSAASMGSLNQTYPPYDSHCHQIRMRTRFMDITRSYWERWSFETMKNQQCDLDVVDNRISVLIKILYDESYDLGYALRRHNARMANSQGKPIILQNVLEDWMSMRYDLSLERTAAVVHLQTVLMASAMLHEWMGKMEDFKAAKMREMAKRIETNLKKMKGALDLRDDIWAMGGYNIERADQGMFHDIEMRNRTFSCFRDYLTTTASSQAGQGTSDLSHIDGWDVPLMPKDGRNPPSQPDAPSWDPQPSVMMNQQQQNEADAQRRTAPGAHPAHPPSSGGGADSSAGSTGASKRPPFKQPPTSKPRPSTPPAPKEWVIAKVPTGYIFRTSSMPDHRNSAFITSAWMDEFNSFLLSIVQGPAAVATHGSVPQKSDVLRMHGLRDLQSRSSHRGCSRLDQGGGLVEVLQSLGEDPDVNPNGVLLLNSFHVDDAWSARH